MLRNYSSTECFEGCGGLITEGDGDAALASSYRTPPKFLSRRFQWNLLVGPLVAGYHFKRQASVGYLHGLLDPVFVTVDPPRQRS